jgi:hypothetical protein
MVAIDLLAKIQAGSDSIGKNGDRFKAFVNFVLDPATYGSDIGLIHKFRNALHHSYRMHTNWTPDGSRGHRASWQFGLIDSPTVTHLTWDTTDSTIINLHRLHKEVERGTERFHQFLKSSSDPAVHRNFESMFAKHGWMAVSRVNVNVS